MPGDPGEGGSTGGGGGGQSQASPAPAGPAVGEEFQWRRRVIAAEQQLEQLQAKLADAEAELVKARTALIESERGRALDAELAGAQPLDVETARLLAQQALEGGGDTTPAAVIADLKRRKPFLFKSDQAPRASAMGASAGGGGPDSLADLADRARQSGDRRALLRYLRSKRGV